MPMRFRSVVPYTMPGVLVLIGWWWYTSRKKEQLIDQNSEVSPSPVSFKDSHLESSNGLLYEDESPISSNLSNQNTENEIISPIHLQDTEAISSQEHKFEVPFCVLEEVDAPSNLFPPKFGNKDLGEKSTKPLKDPETDPSSVFIGNLEKCPPKELDLFSENLVEDAALQSNACKDTTFSNIAIHLSDAERPEPEGEVATHHSAVNAQEEIVSIFRSAKTHRMMISDEDSLENPLSVQDSDKKMLTGASTILSKAQGTTSADMHFKRNTQEMNDLELLAAGLISEVLSAATQEVLGITNCEVTPNDKPSDESSATLTTGTQCSQHDLTRGASLGCSLSQGDHELTKTNVETRIQKTHNAQNEAWPKPSHQGNPVLLTKCRGDEAAMLAEDSACSTYHSEEGISSENLQSSLLENPADFFKVKDLSAKEAIQHQSVVGSITKETEENSYAMRNVKRVNGSDLRNGAHGTCELDTDQSGGSDVNSMDSVDSGCTMGVCENQGSNTASSTSELIIWEIEVPKHLVGRLIGKQGRYVSFLKQNSGAKIYISTLPYTQEFQICHIEGLQQQVDKALSFIGKKFKDLDLTNLYAPPLTLPSLPITSWLLLPSGVTVEVIVVNIVSAGHIFVQQHTHPTYHALRSLDQQMFLCYSQPGTPALPSPAEVGVICAAPAVDGAWWRAQVITFYKETEEVEIRYVDYGGYDKVKIDSLRQIRSDFVTLPFQGAEVLLDNITPLPGEDCFSTDATTILEEMTRGVALLAQVSNYDNNTGLPLVHLWNLVGDEDFHLSCSPALTPPPR
ncbi:A kinase (PRKA) anchor protein 1b isoform X2 [Fundulus heteroclitus]|uniref:A kinase (PRKA) anchor protein 1b isoform X2 n=1 Tax=Fundulus heteroclitus TaxID=8078 RepID=UPI00165BB38B|nr:A kinase (PRKA) anchor protein 1b isoform X2 [Fundulus heteroclitus]